MKYLLVLPFLLFGLVAIASDDETSYVFESANFKQSKSSLQNRIKFPKSIAKLDGDITVVVRCDAFIKRNGKINSNFCYQETGLYYPYVMAINRGVKRAVMNPGKVNGTSRKVYFQYYVVFMKKSGILSVDVLPNSGLEVEKYGFDYTSPQRYKEGRGNFGAGCGYGQKITVNAVIDEKGVPESVFAVGDNVGEKCKELLEKTFLQQKYIPAMNEGKAFKAFYSEQIFDLFREV